MTTTDITSLRHIDRCRLADRALLVALTAPPALIWLLVALGAQFAVAVIAVFALVFIVTTAMDIAWVIRRRRGAREGR